MQAEAINRRLVKFIWAAAIFFAWSCIQGAIQGMEPVHEFLQLGPAGIIGAAHVHVSCLGWTSLALFAAIYYLVPILSGKSIAAPRLIEWIFWIWVIATAVTGVLMIIAGVIGGSAVAAGMAGPQVGALITPYMMIVGILGMVGAVVAIMFVVQILVSLARGAK